MKHHPATFVRMLARRVFRTALLVAIVGLAGAPCAWALQADELALVVNANVPASHRLAEFYAQQRHVPDGRIISISLPIVAPEAREELTPQQYDLVIVPAVRDFLLKNHLERQVKCLVTFYGMPLRIIARDISAADKAEHAALQAQLEKDALPRIKREVTDLEALAKELNPAFVPGSGNSVALLTARAGRAMNAAFQQIVGLPPDERRNVAFGQLISSSERLMGSDGVMLRLVQPQVAALSATPPTTQEAQGARERILAAERQIAQLQQGPHDAATRAKIRDTARKGLGMLVYAEVLQLQSALLDATESQAALDSELALLWWPQYPKARWQLNPLNWHSAGHVWTPGPVLMVTRLDAPTEELVHAMIETSVKIEQTGLQGQIVLDGRGKTGANPYAVYDQTIRNCAEFLRQRSKATVVFDDNEALIAPHSLKNIACYCGWYSLRNYAPPGQFNAGAVGFHVASFELITLHLPNEKGWVRGLLSDGVVATVGPVAEPYLQSFPPADEFFPLLLTGKLTLAEVFWRTSPWVSWMQTCIGDPLYRPYMAHPAVQVSDLPSALRVVAGEPATQPTTGPNAR